MDAELWNQDHASKNLSACQFDMWIKYNIGLQMLLMITCLYICMFVYLFIPLRVILCVIQLSGQPIIWI